MPTITVTPGWAGPLAACGLPAVVVQVAGVGPGGPNSVTTATATDFAAGRLFASNGVSVVPVTAGDGVELVATVPPITQYVLVNTDRGSTAVSDLLASAEVTFAGTVTAGAFEGDGSGLTSLPSGQPAGVDTQVQFNDGGAFGGNAALAFDKVAGTLKVRQPGGTPGTDEVRHRHTGSRAEIESKDGPIRLIVPTSVGSGTAIEMYRQDGTANSGFDVSAVGAVTCGNLVCPDISGVQVQNLGVRFAATKGLLWYSGNWTDTLQTGIHQAAAKVVELNNGTRGGAGGTARSVPLSPSQITADQNNYAPGVAMYYRLSSDASRTLTGLSVGQVDGQVCEIWNVGSNNIVLAHDSASSSAANQFLNSGGADITLAGGEMTFLRWFSAEQSGSGGWRVVKG